MVNWLVSTMNRVTFSNCDFCSKCNCFEKCKPSSSFQLFSYMWALLHDILRQIALFRQDFLRYNSYKSAYVKFTQTCLILKFIGSVCFRNSNLPTRRKGNGLCFSCLGHNHYCLAGVHSDILVNRKWEKIKFYMFVHFNVLTKDDGPEDLDEMEFDGFITYRWMLQALTVEFFTNTQLWQSCQYYQ